MANDAQIEVDTFQHTIEFLAIVVAVIWTQFLFIWGTLISDRVKFQPIRNQVIWSMCIFIYLLNFWWAMLAEVPKGVPITFQHFVSFLTQPVLIFFALVMLFPLNIGAFSPQSRRAEDLVEYYDENRRVFFLFCIVMVLNTILDEYTEYDMCVRVLSEPTLSFADTIAFEYDKYVFRGAAVLIFVLALLFDRFRAFHTLLALTGLTLMVTFIVRYSVDAAARSCDWLIAV